MKYVYLLKLRDFTESNVIKVVVVSGSSWQEMDIKGVGKQVKLFSRNNIILYKEKIELFDNVYDSIFRSFRSKSIGGLHITNGQYYLTVDNSIWYVHNNEQSANDEYNKILFRI